MNNVSPTSRPPSRHNHRSGRVLFVVIIALLLIVGVWKLPFTQSLLSSVSGPEEDAFEGQYILHTAEVSPFRITITENGTIDSLQNSTITNTVEGTTTIIAIVPEGSRVEGPTAAEFDGVVEYVDIASESEKTIRVTAEDGMSQDYSITMGPFTELLVKDGESVTESQYLAGDMLCELDSSSLVEAEKEQRIQVTTARADLEKAAKNLEIQQTTNESVLAQAQLAEKLAQLDLEKYTFEGGEYDQAKRTLEGEIKQLEEELAMAQEDYEKVRDQARRGYTNLNNLEAARIKVSQQKILKDVKVSELALLEKFTRVRTVSELEQTAEDSKRETRRAELEGQAAMAGLKADYDATELTLQVEEEKLERLLKQIRACRLIAPQQGEVVYATQVSRRSEPVVIEEGATVRERQAIINLPDLEQMKVDARIHESRISRVAVGQPVEVSVDAVTSVTYHGVLETISSVPVPGNWPNTDLKEYEAAIRITDEAALVRQLKPGMTAQVSIIVDDRQDDVLQVPVQSVVAIADQFFSYAIGKDGAERRKITVGDANDEYMEILDGIDEGDRVIMNPHTHFKQELNELEVELLSQLAENAAKIGGRPGAGQPGGIRPGAKPGKPVAQRPEAGNARAGGGGGPPDPTTIMKRVDKNGDGVISRDESDMRGNFDRYDSDGDGKITADELKKGFQR